MTGFMKFSRNSAALAAVLTVLALTAPAFAGQPGFPGERVIGPPIDGVVVIELVDDFIFGGVSYGPAAVGTFVGHCKKNSVSFVFPDFTITTVGQFNDPASGVTEENLTNYRLESLPVPPECYEVDHTAISELAITGVQKFNKVPAVPIAGAELSISLVESK